jgi:3-oxoacyl-[acyl-carrier-protein] synthase II
MRRVAVTGLGLITPLGTGVEKNWRALCRGESGIDRIAKFDPAEFPCQIAGEVRDFDPSAYIEPKEMKKMDPFIQYALAAGIMALEDSGLRVTPENAHRVGVYIGSGIGGLGSIERQALLLAEKGPRRITPFFIPMSIANLASGQVSIRFGAKGPNSAVSTACATGTHAIGDAYRIIQRGEADAMIAGGTEAAVTPLGVAGFAAMKALSTRNDEPRRASRPFDRERDGFVLGEGAGIVVLEERESARRRGARIYGELLGYGMSGDGHHMTAPPDDGEGAVRCMQLALKDAGLPPEAVGYVNAHGTSTFADAIETRAIKTVFGEQAYRIPVSSTKSMTGHLLGAAGGVEAIYSVLALYHGILPPTINQEFPDPECDLDYIPNKARPLQAAIALSNSFGFGGTNATLLFRAPVGE